MKPTFRASVGQPPALHLTVISSSPYEPPWTEGVRNLIRKLAQDFARRNAQVTIISPGRTSSTPAEEPNAQVIEVSVLPEWQGAHTWVTVLAHMRLWLATGWAVRNIKPKPDVLLVIASVSSVTGVRTAFLKAISRKPIVLYVTGLSRPRKGYRWGLSADRILTGTPFLKEWFPEAEVVYPFLPSSVKPFDRLSNQSKQTGSGRTTPFNVAFLGSFEPGRGVEILLHAMALVNQRSGDPVQLTIGWNGVGSDNYENIQHLVDELGIRSITKMHQVVEPNEFYRQADVLVIPRIADEYMSFPVRIIEAMHTQTPLIVTRVCGMEQLIEGCGLSIEPGNAEKLANAILELLGNQDLYRQFQRNCAAALKKFDSQVALDKLFETIRSFARDD